MTSTVSQKNASLHVMKAGRVKGKGTSLSALSISEHAITGRNVQTFQTRDQEYGYDEYGDITLKRTFNSPPGGLNSFTVEFGRPVGLDFMEDKAFAQDIFAMWEFSAPCGLRSDPFAWLRGGRLDYHSGAKVDTYTPADTSRTGEDNIMVNNVAGTYEKHMILLPLEGSDISPSSADNDQNINTIFGLVDPLVEGCAPGYLGPDQHLFIAADADTGVPAEAFYSDDGGGTWTILTNQPFGNDANIIKGAARLQLGTGARVLFFNGTAGTSGAEASWGDAIFGNVPAMTHNLVQVTSTASDLVTAAEWLFGDGVYVGAGQGSANVIAVSTDRGKTYTSVWSGTPVVNAFAKGYGQDCQDVYAVGTSGFIAKRISNQGAFLTLTPPAGGNDFTAVNIDQYGYIYAGYGTELVVSIDDAATAGNWTTVIDFGGTYEVKKIFFKQGDSMHLYVVVDDPGVVGEFWQSNNAGGDFIEITSPTNLGYNDAYASVKDLNKYFLAGDVNSGAGVVSAFLPGASGC